MSPTPEPALCSFDLLPRLLQSIVHLIGLHAAMRLVEVYGGVRIYIPTEARATPEHEMALVVGFENLVKLAREFGGLPHFQLPKATQALRAVRDEDIARAYASDKTARELALQYRLTESQVVRIVGRSGVKAPLNRQLCMDFDKL